MTRTITQSARLSIADWFAAGRPRELRLLTAGGGGGVMSDSMIAGSRAGPALDADKRVVATLPSGSSGDLLQALRDSPVTGCTSVLSMALAKSGWNPLDLRTAGDFSGFQRYLSAVEELRFFDAPPSRSYSMLDLRSYADPQAMARAIAALLPDASDDTRVRIARSIVTMAHSVFDVRGDIHQAAMLALFTQHVVTPDAAHVSVCLHWCQTVMALDRETHKGTVHQTSDHRLIVQRFRFELSRDRWLAQVDAIARAQIVAVEAWLARTITPRSEE